MDECLSCALCWVCTVLFEDHLQLQNRWNDNPLDASGELFVCHLTVTPCAFPALSPETVVCLCWIIPCSRLLPACSYFAWMLASWPVSSHTHDLPPTYINPGPRRSLGLISGHPKSSREGWMYPERIGRSIWVWREFSPSCTMFMVLQDIFWAFKREQPPRWKRV